MKPLVSVIIVSYNGKDYLSACLNSVSAMISCPHEVIIVDNASTDGSARFVRENFPSSVMIENNANMGFAGANNRGAEAAQGKYILLLNQDTILRTDIAPAIKIHEENPRCGIVGAKMLDAGGNYSFSAGHFPSPALFVKISSIHCRQGAFKTGTFLPGEDKIRVDWVEGSFMLIKTSLWREIGGMDETYFMYGEDVDFCKMAANFGYETFYSPLVSYIHFAGFDFSRVPLLMKGFLRFHKKFSGPFERALAKAVIITGLYARIFANTLSFIVTKKQEKKVYAMACLKSLKEFSAPEPP